ncbi:MAG: XRE family transcriptional regulator [Clostridiales bacterium]|nr:XRE family transcriptional regulator [Clostridiales bacterium]
MDGIQKIKDLTEERGWTEYRLVKESGIAASTISNIFHRNTLPNIITLEAICKTFGITLSQFFSDDNVLYPSEDQRAILLEWSYLNDTQRTHLLQLLQSMRE